MLCSILISYFHQLFHFSYFNQEGHTVRKTWSYIFLNDGFFSIVVASITYLTISWTLIISSWVILLLKKVFIWLFQQSCFNETPVWSVYLGFSFWLAGTRGQVVIFHFLLRPQALYILTYNYRLSSQGLLCNGRSVKGKVSAPVARAEPTGSLSTSSWSFVLEGTLFTSRSPCVQLRALS